MSIRRIALVTGANKGIGFEICKQLAQKGIKVILSARDEDRGKTAVSKLIDCGLDVVFHQLDVTDEHSISSIHEYILQTFGRLDILVNNAAIFIDKEQTGLTVCPEVVISTYQTNVVGPLMLCQKFIPMMKQNEFGRIVNLSSELGLLHIMDTGQYPAYRMSKTGLNALTCIMASLVKDYNIIINSMSPGWVRTDMGGYDAPGKPEDGAKIAVWLAFLPDDGPRGQFFSNGSRCDW